MKAGWDRLTPEGERMAREMKALVSKKVFVGFQAGEVRDDKGADIAQVAAWNELGTSTSPPRPFLRKSVDENLSEINAECQKAVKTVASGGTAEQALKKIGVTGVALVQDKIVSGDFTPNAPATIRKKHSARPLIDTGRMRQSVKYVIKKKGEIT